MVLRFIERLWNRQRSSLWRERKREQDRLAQQQRADDKQRKEQEEDRADTLLAVLLSDEFLRFEQQLRNDLADATTAARLAYAQAEEAERVALDALRLIQDEALVLSDGRGVYFDADGNLFSEDHRRIDDPVLAAEARDALDAQPGASTYEDYSRVADSLDRIRTWKAELAQTLDRLDDLQERIDKGDLTVEELIEAREKLDRLVADLPPEARELYQDLQAARERDRLPGDEAEQADTPTAQSDFERAASRQSEALDRARQQADSTPDRQPVYKRVPPFE